MKLMEEYGIELLIKKIGVRIRELRKKRNMTQLDLAIRSNIDERQIQRLEAAHTSPTIKTLYKVAIGIDISFEEFISFLIKT